MPDRLPVKCPVCKKKIDFSWKRSNSKYCSDACRKRSWYVRQLKKGKLFGKEEVEPEGILSVEMGVQNE